jgi:Fructose-1-6-bisphosphatase, N-terminal domain
MNDATITLLLFPISRFSFFEFDGSIPSHEVQGEDQKKLDVISNDIFCNTLRSSGRTGVIASEEEDLPVAVENTFSGNYVVVFDPLDGSSNIDAGISVGSIFGNLFSLESSYVLPSSPGLHLHRHAHGQPSAHCVGDHTAASRHCKPLTAFFDSWCIVCMLGYAAVVTATASGDRDMLAADLPVN